MPISERRALQIFLNLFKPFPLNSGMQNVATGRTMPFGQHQRRPLHDE